MLTYTTTDLEGAARELCARYGRVVIYAHRRADYQHQIDYSKLSGLPVFRLMSSDTGLRILEQWQEAGGVLVQYKSHIRYFETPASIWPTCPLSREQFVMESKGVQQCAVICLPVSWDLLRRAVDALNYSEEIGDALYRYVKFRAGNPKTDLLRAIARLSKCVTPDYVALRLQEVQRHLQITQKTLREMARHIGMAAGYGGEHFTRFDLFRILYPPVDGSLRRHLELWDWLQKQPQQDGWAIVFRTARRPPGYSRAVMAELARAGCLERSTGWGLFAVPVQAPRTVLLQSRRQRARAKLEEWKQQVWQFPDLPLSAPAASPVLSEAT